MKSPLYHLQRCWLILLCLLMFITNAAQAVTIFPTRVVLTDREKTAQVEVINSGSETESFYIQLERKRMTELGEFRSVAGEPLPGELFADQIVRYSPRRVTLAPGAGQTIRLMLKMPDNLPEGEYRSHLSINHIPNATDLKTSAGQSKEAKDINIKLTAYANVSIPVIVRHGKLTAQLTIDDLAYHQGTDQEPPVVEFTLRRSGTKSVYGDIAVTLLTEDGKKEPIAAVNGVAVYVPNLSRKARVTMRHKAQLAARGKLVVTFTEHGADKAMAEAAIALP